MIERKIIIGIIVSTDFLQQIRDIWDVRYFESSAAKRLARWVWEYFQLYNRAPGREIEDIFFDKIKTDKVAKDIAEEIEEDILPSLSEEYEQENINLDYLLEQTKKYFNERNLAIHTKSIDAALSKGDVMLAEKLAIEYKPLAVSVAHDINLSDEGILARIDKAFNSDVECLIRFPGPLGHFWNDQLVRGGFVAFLAPEKRGKTWWLLEMADRACSQGRNVAFFQAGDMTEGQQLKRICIHKAAKSNLVRYCGEQYQPIRDCIYNQLGTCKVEENWAHDFGVFPDKTYKDVKYDLVYEDLVQAYEQNPDYKPCHVCYNESQRSIGVPWLKKVDLGSKPLDADEAKKVIQRFYIAHKKQFKLSTHPNDTLNIRDINAILDLWEKQDGYIADVIIIDYADLLIVDGEKEERQKQNKIWKGLRNLSQVRGNPLVITATQADAMSYEKNTLKMTNFSEDKRKYGHVTAMWGLNQDNKDREKKIGLMRINEIVKREGEFFASKEITVLQNLRRGKPFLGSYW